jgi:hypothetical protein
MIPLRFRDVLAETGKLFPSDADLWKRMAEFISRYNLKSYFINELTCIYVSSGNEKSNAKVVSWKTGLNNNLNGRRLTWRDKIAAVQTV